MKILIIGANGQIGKLLINLLKQSNEYSPVAMVRSEEQVQYFEKLGIEAVLGDLEEPVSKLITVMHGCEAVVFTAGSGGKTGPDKTLTVDLDGAIKSIEAAEKAGVDRYIMVSAIQAHNRENWHPPIKPYFVAKHYADRVLVQSKLNYTILRPGRLTNDPGTGRVMVATNLERDTISRQDVAEAIFTVLNESNTHKKGFDIVAGNTPVATAIKQV